MTPAFFLAVMLAALPADAPVVRLSVRPMAAPKPALKYLLLPEVRELNAGNPVQWYMRCFAEQRNFFFGKEGTAQRQRYLALPMAELPGEELRTYGGSALTQADWAARLDTPDWQMTDRVQAEGTDLRQPELAALWILGTGLRVRFRGEIARRDYDAAVRTAKTMFALARHLGEHPTLAANLVGLEVATLALDTLDEMVAQPGCPNLYWALTDLPGPLVELRKGVQGGRSLVDAELRGVRDDVVMTDAQVDELVGRLSGRIGFVREQAGLPPRGLRAVLKSRLEDSARLGPARARILNGVPVEDVLDKIAALRVMSFPPAQVILLDEKRQFEVRRDEELKLLALAPWQIDALPRGAETRAEGLFDDFLPRIVEARRAQARVEQRVALLRHVEALRLYAADHDGKLPASLADVAVPLPADPLTGKPFAYTVEGATAQLGGSPRYEVTIRK